MLGGLTESVVGVLVLIAAGLAALVSIGHYTRKGVTTMLRFFRRLDRALDNVEKQLYPNGGASLRDAVNRIQEHLGIEDIAADVHLVDPPVL
jgi:hypothetical protein